MNNAIVENINFIMSDKITISEDKENIFKELIIEYLIQNIFGETNGN